VRPAGRVAKAAAISSSDNPTLRAARMNANRLNTFRSYRRWPPDVRDDAIRPCFS
jgi:hypothetical protein